MPTITHLTTEQLHAGLEEIERAPKLEGVLELIVRRPAVDAREVLQEGELDWSRDWSATRGVNVAARAARMGVPIRRCS